MIRVDYNIVCGQPFFDVFDENTVDKINLYDIIMISKRKKEFDTYGRKNFSW